MMRLLASFLTALLLLQSFGRELLVLHFAVNQAHITARFCENKARPRLHCNGKCYLAKQLRRAENGPTKAPTSALAKVQLVATMPSQLQLPPAGWVGPVAALRYAPAIVRPDAAAPMPGIFHPPAWLG
jgi:hypothetical protein